MNATSLKQVVTVCVCGLAVAFAACSEWVAGSAALAAQAREHLAASLVQSRPAMELRAIPPRYALKGENRMPIIDEEGNVTGFLDSVKHEDVSPKKVLGQSKVIATSKDLKPNSKVHVGPGGEPTVIFELQGKGAQDFSDFTAKSVGHFLAIVVKGKMISCPCITTRVPGKGAIWSPDFKGPRGVEEAKKLAKLLNEDALRFSARPRSSR
jgi:preprotein translocase subunit SecD